MDNNKSLGSTPIGYNVNPTSYSFIRDLGVSSKGKQQNESTSVVDNVQEQKSGVSSMQESTTSAAKKAEPGNKKGSAEGKSSSKKKIVSYYLDVSLIERLKKMADTNNHYYSSVASKAIRDWVEQHGF